MSAHRACGAGCHRPWRPRPAGGHLGLVRPVRRDAPAIRKQDAGVLEHHDAVAEQAPTLFGMRRHDAGRLAIRCVRGRTGRLMLAHDAPLSSGRVLRRAAGPAAALPAAPAGWCPQVGPLSANLAARGLEHRRTRAAGERSMSPRPSHGLRRHHGSASMRWRVSQLVITASARAAPGVCGAGPMPGPPASECAASPGMITKATRPGAR